MRGEKLEAGYLILDVEVLRHPDTIDAGYLILDKKTFYNRSAYRQAGSLRVQ
jgi:hypothetical protein